jgi:hypothetical protein
MIRIRRSTASASQLPDSAGSGTSSGADKYFSTDVGIQKKFDLGREGMSLIFRWDIFNLTNSVYFDATSLNGSIDDPGTFGDYTAILGRPRQMQASLKLTF